MISAAPDALSSSQTHPSSSTRPFSFSAGPPMQRISTYDSSNDPLNSSIKPPKDETAEHRSNRLAAERDAKAISDAIDAEIAAERDRKRGKGAVEARLLLLGQAESGKSTLQKQFQLLYAPKSLDGERESWKIVIYLNIVRALKPIFETLDENIVESSSISRTSLPDDRELAALRLRISPMTTMEETLASALTGGIQLSSKTPKQGFYSKLGWQWSTRTSKTRRSFTSESKGDDLNDNSKVVEPMEHILVACGQDICTLWAHNAVRLMISNKKLKLNEWSEYFLNNVGRIASRGYIPTDNDILHARLQTLGLAEHRFVVNWMGNPMSWILYDVGGARGQRAVWASYFTEATAIVFLAPLSAFDQTLDEDNTVNRMLDSIELFKDICANKLLKNVHMVLFLNKADLLRRKLDSGVQLKRYVTSYGDRPNQYDHAVSYFKSHYTQVYRQSASKHMEKGSPPPRLLYAHVTTMVDTEATERIISNVRDTIFRSHLKSAALA